MMLYSTVHDTKYRTRLYISQLGINQWKSLCHTVYCCTSGWNVYDLSLDYAAGVWGGVQRSLSQPGRGTRGHSTHSSPHQAHLVRLPGPHALKCPSFTGPSCPPPCFSIVYGHHLFRTQKRWLLSVFVVLNCSSVMVGVHCSPLCWPTWIDFFPRLSFDEGREWNRYSFTSSPLYVDGVLGEPGEDSLIMTWDQSQNTQTGHLQDCYFKRFLDVLSSFLSLVFPEYLAISAIVLSGSWSKLPSGPSSLEDVPVRTTRHGSYTTR